MSYTKLKNKDLRFPFYFTYANADGVLSKRKLIEGKISSGYLEGYQEGVGYRTFRLDRIQQIITEDEFLDSYLDESSDSKLTSSYVNESVEDDDNSITVSIDTYITLIKTEQDYKKLQQEFADLTSTLEQIKNQPITNTVTTNIPALSSKKSKYRTIFNVLRNIFAVFGLFIFVMLFIVNATKS